MTKLLLVSLQIEFETTPITINDLLEKHNIELDDLKGWELWKKQSDDLNAPEEDIIVPTIITTPQDIITTPQEDAKDGEEKLKDLIHEFKVDAMEEAKNFMKNNLKFAEVKEFKDMVNIVDSIEKSLEKNKGNQGPTVNILVQTLAENYSDDC